MLNHKRLAAAAASAFLLASASAFAAGGHQERSAMISALENAKISPSDAITAAEKETQGKASNLRFVDEHNTPAYIVEIQKPGAVTVVRVDPKTGQVSSGDQTELAALGGAKTSLAQAVEIAEKDAGGKALYARLVDRRGHPEYEVAVLKDGRVARIAVDTNGQVLARAARNEHRTHGQPMPRQQNGAMPMPSPNAPASPGTQVK